MSASIIAAAIGALTIRGIINKALGETPEAVDTRAGPVLARSTHEPDFITEYLNQQLSLGGNSQTQYTLNYKFFHSPVGQERALFSREVDIVTSLQTAIDALLANRKLGGAKYIALDSLPTFRTVLDASANEFHGAVISLRVTEF